METEKRAGDVPRIVKEQSIVRLSVVTDELAHGAQDVFSLVGCMIRITLIIRQARPYPPFCTRNQPEGSALWTSLKCAALSSPLAIVDANQKSLSTTTIGILEEYSLGGAP